MTQLFDGSSIQNHHRSSYYICLRKWPTKALYLDSFLEKGFVRKYEKLYIAWPKVYNVKPIPTFPRLEVYGSVYLCRETSPSKYISHHYLTMHFKIIIFSLSKSSFRGESVIKRWVAIKCSNAYPFNAYWRMSLIFNWDLSYTIIPSV